MHRRQQLGCIGTESLRRAVEALAGQVSVHQARNLDARHLARRRGRCSGHVQAAKLLC